MLQNVHLIYEIQNFCVPNLSGDFPFLMQNLRGEFYLRAGWPLVLICTDMYFLYIYGKCTAKCTAKTPNFEDVLINVLIFGFFFPTVIRVFPTGGGGIKEKKKRKR